MNNIFAAFEVFHSMACHLVKREAWLSN